MSGPLLLFQSDSPFPVYRDSIHEYIRLRKRLHLPDDGSRFIRPGTYAISLDERMNLALQEITVDVCLDLKKRRIT